MEVTPNVNRPPSFVDLPIEFPSGAMVQELWDKWLAFANATRP